MITTSNDQVLAIMPTISSEMFLYFAWVMVDHGVDPLNQLGRSTMTFEALLELIHLFAYKFGIFLIHKTPSTLMPCRIIFCGPCITCFAIQNRSS
jgi:hypothetical protein